MTTDELKKQLYAALSKSAALAPLVGSHIYHLQAPAGTSSRVPYLVYSVISDVPILSGDDAEYQSAVTMRIHIVVDTGSDYGKIYAVTNPLMLGLGYMRYQCNEIIDDGHIVYVTDYKIGVDA